MKNFDQQVVFITGAASGIGAALARYFAQEGAHLALSDIQLEAGEQIAESLRAKGAKVTFTKLDVASHEEVKQVVEAAATHFGRIDIAINNAGIGAQYAPTTHVSLDDWDRVIAVNQSRVFYGMREQLKVMAKTTKWDSTQ